MSEEYNTTIKLRKLYDEEENLSRRLITVRRLIAIEEEIWMEELFKTILERLDKK